MGQFKQGLDYFPFSIGLLKDRKLRRPKLKHGYVVNDIYLSLLELIYSDKGYYICYGKTTKEDVIWDILENLQGKYCPDAETVEQVIGDLVACGLFSDDHFKSEILTSKRIQQTYYAATVERKAVNIDFDIWFLNEEEMRKLSSKSVILVKCLNRSNESLNRSNESLNRSNETESKVEESKVKESMYMDTHFLTIKNLYNSICTNLVECKELTNKRKQLIKSCTYSEEELKILFQRANKSSFLQGNNSYGFKANFDWIMKKDNAIKVLEGIYDDSSNSTIKKNSQIISDKHNYSQEELNTLFNRDDESNFDF